jgi:hypothetical protein
MVYDQIYNRMAKYGIEKYPYLPEDRTPYPSQKMELEKS